MDLLIGLDVGTSAVKGVLISAEGERIARAKRATPFVYPQPSFIEVEPEAHYLSVCDLIQELASKAPAGSRVRALAMAAASGNTLLLDKNDRPLTNIINWMDERGGSFDIPGFDRQHLHRVVGWPWKGNPMSFGHLYWLKKNRPEICQKTARYCMNSDWLLYRLSGMWGMDYSTATTFYLQDQVNRRWHKPILEFLNIPETAVSDLMPSGAALGPLTDQGARDTGLTRDTLVVLGAFDHPCAARGTGFLDPGDLLLSCGTSWVGFYPIEDRDLALSQGLLIDPFLTPEGPWGVMFALTEIGNLIDWYIDNLITKQDEGSTDKYTIFSESSAAVPAGAHGFYINPYIDSKHIPETELDLYALHSRAEIARAVMEGPALRMRRNIEKLAKVGIKADRIAMVGGPAESHIWPRIVAEVTGLELKLINGQTAGAVGAAILAALGAGLFDNVRQAFEAMGGSGTVINPAEEAVNKYNMIYEGYLERYEND